MSRPRQSPLQRLPREFYRRSALVVARELLGKHLVRSGAEGELIGRIVEVEAYLGTRDPASHAYRGETARNGVMFRDGGHLYVYFTYGMHFCANVVTGRTGHAGAVLLRAVEPLAGLDLMARRRGQKGVINTRELCSGPAKLCQAFGLSRSHNGLDLCNGPVWIGDPPGGQPPSIIRTPRVGIRMNTEPRWRFIVRGSTFVSRARPGPPLLRRGG